ncbi:MAG TPA: hypothetical protein VG097_02085, partial [Gemmata sp.]|nr:hypothetical protein [Gemmata sp.]
MPIRFRCGYCNRLLGIARRKAGSETTCPHCGYTLTVPDDPTGDTTEMEDLDDLLNPASSPAPQTHQPAGERNNAVAQPKRQTKDPASNGHAHSSSAPFSSAAPAGTRSTKAPASTGSAPSSAPDTRSPGERPLFEGDL